MYQSIDDNPQYAADAVAAPVKPAPRRAFTVFLVLAVTGLIVLGIYNNRAMPTLAAHSSIDSKATEAFRKIQAEPTKAIRKARLIDFVDHHKTAPVIRAAKAQLSVLNHAEARDWASLSDQLFSPRMSDAEKSAALELYVQNWGEGKIGTRDNKIQSYRRLLAPAIVEENVTIDFAPNIQITSDGKSKNLAGAAPVIAPVVVAPEPILEASLPAPPPDPIIEHLRIRKPSSPVYPSRAFRKGIPALVKVSMNVDEKGRVKFVEVIDMKAERYERDFARASRRAARRIRYHPKMVNGIAVPVVGVEKTFLFDPHLKPRL